jgi:hypothetical protein
MNHRPPLPGIVAVLVGFASGEPVLAAALQADPSLGWQDIPLLTLGCAVVSMQLLLFIAGAVHGAAQQSRLWWYAGWAGAAIVAAGLSAVAVAAATADLTPQALLVLAIGLGLCCGSETAKKLAAFRRNPS